MKKYFSLPGRKTYVHACFLITIGLYAHSGAEAQSCPTSSTTTITTYTNTYYPGTASAAAGTTTITLGNAVGSTPIAIHDILLVIQMQGAQVNSGNSVVYGDGATGSGYSNNANLLAGQMEYVVANSAVALTGGTRTLTIQSALVNSYKSAAYGTDGQYTFQVIRVPMYYNLTLNGTITPPAWNGSTGGVIVLNVTQTLNMNGKTIDASGTGFRGGGGKQFSNVGTGAYTDYRALSTQKANGSKGEGIAGTPRYINNNWASPALDNVVEGYPNGSMDMGAPGNAGGGATDGNPVSNSNNAGGGGGGNGGTGGLGGHGWNTHTEVTGGLPGAIFAQESPSRLVMGGGGGAGSTDGGTGTYGPPVGATPGSGVSSSGMPGGGIVMVTAGYISGTGTINVSGVYTNSGLANDGGGGGGAGGSVVITAGGNGLSGVTVHADGANGSTNTGAGAQHGPGGGGGGGYIYSNTSLAAATANAGAAGSSANTVPLYGGITYYATAGAAGVINESITQSQPRHSRSSVPHWQRSSCRCRPSIRKGILPSIRAGILSSAGRLRMKPMCRNMT